MHFRRWTRMTFNPAIKYFNKYGLLDRGYQKFMPLMKLQNPQNQNKSTRKLSKAQYAEKDFDTKLIDKLFLKYPDLKYEPISHRKYSGRKFNTFSYAYSFIEQQKKLIKQGYQVDKAFQIVQQKYQQKMQRKLDQTLLSRGLAIGNRAKSFLTIYQQQVQQQSKLKVLRTKREVQKYEDRLHRIRNRVQGNEEQNQFDIDNYERMFTKIISQQDEVTNVDLKQKKIQNRVDYVNNFQTSFKNIFNQFYQRAASKDRLQGLTDQDIINKINSSPNKIKRQNKILIQYLKKRGSVSLDNHGQVRVSQTQNPKLREFLLASPEIKAALLNDRINYEKPTYKKSTKDEFARRKQIFSTRPDKLSKQDADLVRKNKKFELGLLVNKQVPASRQTYKIFQSQEQRLLRLQIKFLQTVLQKQLKELQEKKSASNNIETIQKQNKKINQTEINFKQLIDKFRRVKYRLESRYKQNVAEEFLFKEHYTLKDQEFSKDEDYQSLLLYLRRRTEQRRLTSLNQYNDNKVEEFLKVQEVKEAVEGEGQSKKIQ